MSTPMKRPKVGDHIEVFDWHPDVDGNMWQGAVIDEVNDYEILYRLDAYPGSLTRLTIPSDHWRVSN